MNHALAVSDQDIGPVEFALVWIAVLLFGIDFWVAVAEGVLYLLRMF